MHTRANPPTPGASAGTAGVIVPPIIRPCWSCSMLVLVEDAAESVSSADIQVCDPFRIGDQSG